MFWLMFWQLTMLSAIILLIVMIQLIKAYRLRIKVPIKAEQLEDLPAVSVCIPARNETNAMTACLERVLASTYPKLEIIVLDDQSTDNTPHLIKAFAHAGVRFIPGNTPPRGWLGKNYALEQLLEQASGTYVLFLDVDTAISTTTISQLVALMRREKLTMVSVIPQRRDVWRWSTWLGTVRYFWELVLHRTYRPSATSASWMVERRQLLGDFFGLSQWKNTLQPEQALATECAKTGQYQLAVSSPALGVYVEKKWSSQIETSRRQLFPRLGNSLLNALIGVGLLGSVLFFLIISIIVIVGGWRAELWVAAPILCVGIMTILLYYRLVWTSMWWLTPLIAPYIAWQELVVLVASAVGYIRGTITWKDRAIERPER